jgi:hypothetical protein
MTLPIIALANGLLNEMRYQLLIVRMKYALMLSRRSQRRLDVIYKAFEQYRDKDQ